MNDLVQVEDLKKTFSKGDATNWVFILYKFTEIIFHTITSYCIDNLQKRCNGTLMKTSKSSRKENECVMKKFNIT